LIERIGNLLPNPSTLFAFLALLVVLLSWVFNGLGVSIIHPATGQTVHVVSLLNVEGLQRMLLNMVPNFVGFPPLGTVLACLIGIAVAERTGLVTAGLRLIVLATPRRWLAAIVVLGGILSHSGADVGYVLFIPLVAAMFHAAGRHPLAGLAGLRGDGCSVGRGRRALCAFGPPFRFSLARAVQGHRGGGDQGHAGVFVQGHVRGPPIRGGGGKVRLIFRSLRGGGQRSPPPPLGPPPPPPRPPGPPPAPPRLGHARLAPGGGPP